MTGMEVRQSNERAVTAVSGGVSRTKTRLPPNRSARKAVLKVSETESSTRYAQVTPSTEAGCERQGSDLSNSSLAPSSTASPRRPTSSTHYTRVTPGIGVGCERQESDLTNSSVASSSKASLKCAFGSRSTSHPSLGAPLRSNTPSGSSNFNAQASPRANSKASPRGNSTASPRANSKASPRGNSTASPRANSMASPRSNSMANPRMNSTASPRAKSTFTREFFTSSAKRKIALHGQEMPVDTYASPQFDRSQGVGFATGAPSKPSVWDMEAAIDRNWSSNSIFDNYDNNNSNNSNNNTSNYIVGQDCLALDRTSSCPFLSKRNLCGNVVPSSIQAFGLGVALLALGLAIGTFAGCRLLVAPPPADVPSPTGVLRRKGSSGKLTIATQPSDNAKTEEKQSAWQPPESTPAVLAVPDKRLHCCKARSAWCLACQEGTTPDHYCARPENAKIAGCKQATSEEEKKKQEEEKEKQKEEKQRKEKREEELKPKCCARNEARCLACKAGLSVDDYCAKRSHGDVAGCPILHAVVKAPTTTPAPVSCCQLRTAECEACKANIPVDTFCRVLEHLHRRLPGCNGITTGMMDPATTSSGAESVGTTTAKTSAPCCKEHVAKCMACQLGQSLDNFCAPPAPVNISGCPCCKEHKAECLACKKEQPLDVFCAGRQHASLDGCQGFCGFRETHTNYPGGTFQTIGDVANTDRCCGLCRREKRCTSWSWASVKMECSLKRQEHLRREEVKGFVSGLPFLDGLETFQVRSESYNNMCLDAAGSLRIQGCGGNVFKSQWWTVDRLKGSLGSQRGICVPEFGRLGLVHRGPCNESWTSSWAYDFSSGLIRASQGDHCLHAPELNRSGARVIVQPCNPDSDAQRWELWTSEKAPPPGEQRLPNIVRRSRDAGARAEAAVMQSMSFFCLAMVVPWGYEPGLIGMQLDIRGNIFACDEATVYSNTVFDLGGAVTSVVDTDLHCRLGGKWYTALNAPIFRKLWHQVIADGHWRRHTWTIKADADAVFMPHRLATVVSSLSYLAKDGRGIFLNNCRFGLHGPLEVVSKRSLELFEKDGPSKCSLKLAPQEDAWLQKCLLQLGVLEIDRFDSLLAEPACKTPEWEDCSGPQTTFHPFKTAHAYKKCLKQMEWVDAHPSTSTITKTATTSTASTTTATITSSTTSVNTISATTKSEASSSLRTWATTARHFAKASEAKAAQDAGSHLVHWQGQKILG